LPCKGNFPSGSGRRGHGHVAEAGEQRQKAMGALNSRDPAECEGADAKSPAAHSAYEAMIKQDVAGRRKIRDPHSARPRSARRMQERRWPRVTGTSCCREPWSYADPPVASGEHRPTARARPRSSSFITNLDKPDAGQLQGRRTQEVRPKSRVRATHRGQQDNLASTK